MSTKELDKTLFTIFLDYLCAEVLKYEVDVIYLSEILSFGGNYL